MDAGSFINNIKTEDFYEDVVDDVEKRFDTANYEATSLKSIDHYLQEMIKKLLD